MRLRTKLSGGGGCSRGEGRGNSECGNRKQLNSGWADQRVRGQGVTVPQKGSNHKETSHPHCLLGNCDIRSGAQGARHRLKKRIARRGVLGMKKKSRIELARNEPPAQRRGGAQQTCSSHTDRNHECHNHECQPLQATEPAADLAPVAFLQCLTRHSRPGVRPVIRMHLR